jgi:hypothetical protein
MIKVWERAQTHWVAVFEYVHESDFSCWVQGVKVKTESYKYIGDIRFESVYCIDDNAVHQVCGQWWCSLPSVALVVSPFSLLLIHHHKNTTFTVCRGWRYCSEISDVGSNNIVICSEHLSIVKCHIHDKSLKHIKVRLNRIGLEFFMIYTELLAYVVFHYT